MENKPANRTQQEVIDIAKKEIIPYLSYDSENMVLRHYAQNVSEYYDGYTMATGTLILNKKELSKHQFLCYSPSDVVQTKNIIAKPNAYHMIRNEYILKRQDLEYCIRVKRTIKKEKFVYPGHDHYFFKSKGALIEILFSQLGLPYFLPVQEGDVIVEIINRNDNMICDRITFPKETFYATVEEVICSWIRNAISNYRIDILNEKQQEKMVSAKLVESNKIDTLCDNRIISEFLKIVYQEIIPKKNAPFYKYYQEDKQYQHTFYIMDHDVMSNLSAISSLQREHLYKINITVKWLKRKAIMKVPLQVKNDKTGETAFTYGCHIMLPNMYFYGLEFQVSGNEQGTYVLWDDSPLSRMPKKVIKKLS